MENQPMGQSDPNQALQQPNLAPKSSQEGLWWTIGIVVAVAILVAGYFVWKGRGMGPIPSENMKTYTNTQYGFEFKYPNDWTVSQSSFTSGINSGISFVKIVPETQRLANGAEIIVTTEVIDDVEGIEDWKTKNFGNNTFSFAQVKVDNGIDKNWDMYYSNRNNEGTEVLFKLSFINGVNLQESDVEPELDILTDILSSFKFIDPTANWKTYKNDTYGFEMKYPSDWQVREESTVSNPSVYGFENFKANTPIKTVLFESPDTSPNNDFYYYLSFGLKRKNENIILSGNTLKGLDKSNTQAGEMVKIGSKETKTTLLLYNNKPKEVLYSDNLSTGMIQVDEFEIRADLRIGESTNDGAAHSTENIDVRDRAEYKISNQILSTFKFTFFLPKNCAPYSNDSIVSREKKSSTGKYSVIFHAPYKNGLEKASSCDDFDFDYWFTPDLDFHGGLVIKNESTGEMSEIASKVEKYRWSNKTNELIYIVGGYQDRSATSWVLNDPDVYYYNADTKEHKRLALAKEIFDLKTDLRLIDLGIAEEAWSTDDKKVYVIATNDVPAAENNGYGGIIVSISVSEPQKIAIEKVLNDTRW